MVVVMPMEFLVLSLVLGYGLFLLVWSFNFRFLDMFGLLMVVSLWVGRAQRLTVILFKADERLSVDLGLDLFFHLEKLTLSKQIIIMRKKNKIGIYPFK